MNQALKNLESPQNEIELSLSEESNRTSSAMSENRAPNTTCQVPASNDYVGPSEYAPVWEFYLRSKQEFEDGLNDELRPWEHVKPNLVQQMLQMIPEDGRAQRFNRTTGGDCRISDTDLVTSFSFVSRHRARGLSQRDHQLNAEWENRSLTAHWFRDDNHQRRMGLSPSMQAATVTHGWRFSRSRDLIIYALLEAIKCKKLSLYISAVDFCEFGLISKSQFWRAIKQLEDRGMIVSGHTYKDAPDDSDNSVHKHKNYYVVGPMLREIIERDNPRVFRSARAKHRAHMRGSAKTIVYPDFPEWIQQVADGLKSRDRLGHLIAKGEEKKAELVGECYRRFTEQMNINHEELLDSSPRDDVDEDTREAVDLAGGTIKAAIAEETPEEVTVRKLARQDIDSIGSSTILRIVSSMDSNDVDNDSETEIRRCLPSFGIDDYSSTDVALSDIIPNGKETGIERIEKTGNTLRVCGRGEHEEPDPRKCLDAPSVIESCDATPVPDRPAERRHLGPVVEIEARRKWVNDPHSAPDANERKRVAALLEAQIAKMSGSKFFFREPLRSVSFDATKV